MSVQTNGDLAGRIARLKAEKEGLEARMQRRRKAMEQDQQQCRKICKDIERLRLVQLVNVPDGVRLEYRYQAGHPGARLNDCKGVLTDVRRRRGTVDFGDGGKFTISLSQLIPANEGKQGLSLMFPT
jgi:hypothetical protein